MSADLRNAAVGGGGNGGSRKGASEPPVLTYRDVRKHFGSFNSAPQVLPSNSDAPAVCFASSRNVPNVGGAIFLKHGFWPRWRAKGPADSIAHELNRNFGVTTQLPFEPILVGALRFCRNAPFRHLIANMKIIHQTERGRGLPDNDLAASLEECQKHTS